MFKAFWKTICFQFLVMAWSLVSHGQELSITGVYQGKPLFIQNPLANGNQYCIREIYLNGRPLSQNLKISAIEVDFSSIDLYTPVSVRIVHDTLCLPKIVNPQAVLWHSSFRFNSVAVSDEELKWSTRGERDKGIYTIEKLNGEEWLSVSLVESKADFAASEYVYYPEHSEGANKYRIKYEPPSGNYLYSDEVEVVFYKELITFSPKVVSDKITLSRAAAFEILDANENTILSGNSKEIPLRLLKPGSYYIVLEGNREAFVKK